MSSRQHTVNKVLKLLEEHYGEEMNSHVGVGDPFRTLVGCVLSHRTRDENASQAARALFEVAGSPDDVLRLRPEELKRRIRCSRFYNRKAKRILSICRALKKDFGGEVPEDRDMLLSLPGVGPKTADIVLSYAFDRPAIAVDVHIATLAKRLGLVDEKAKPEDVKEALEGLVPPEKYRFIDRALVRLGKEYCRSRNPRCPMCFMSNLCEENSKKGSNNPF
ncbi:MAG: endonuclease III [Candidatus Bathyarchaeia archaeon]